MSNMMWKVYKTEAVNGKIVTSKEEIPETKGVYEENNVINIYTDVAYQTWEGFGGALTEAAGSTYNLMDEKDKQRLVSDYFTEEGMGYTNLRMPIDSCDFSLGHYEAYQKDGGALDMSRVQKNLMPLFEDIREKYGKSPAVMLSPWSPPAFMKTNNDRNHGGSLKDEYKAEWADYICRYIIASRELGIDVRRLSIQNEPNAVQTWDSCVYTPKQEREFLNTYLRAALEKYGLRDSIEIFIWDHNKERLLERAAAIIDGETDDLVDGIAFHWYSGDHFDSLKMFRELFPEKKLILSEACIEFYKFDKDNVQVNAEKYAHDLIGNLNNGMCAFYDWNLLLNEEGGPNHVQNYCDSPYRFDRKERKLTRNVIADYLWHFAHFIRPGDVRLGTSTYTEELEVTAFAGKGGKVKVILLNRTDRPLKANIRFPKLKGDDGESFVKTVIPPQSIVSCE